jgi:hypothetical protein
VLPCTVVQVAYHCNFIQVVAVVLNLSSFGNHILITVSVIVQKNYLQKTLTTKCYVSGREKEAKNIVLKVIGVFVKKKQRIRVYRYIQYQVFIIFYYKKI